MASGMKLCTINEQTDPSWESPDQTFTSLTSSTKNPDLSKLKLTQPANQKTPKAKFGTTNLSKILVAHQILHPYLYPQRPPPQIVLFDQRDSYQLTPWPSRRRLQLQPPPEEEDPVPHHHRHQQQPLHPQWTLSNKFKLPSMPPSADQEEEEEEPQEEDQVHLDPQAVEDLRKTLQHHLHKYQSQRQQMFKLWEQPREHSLENEMKQKTGSTSYEDIIVLTLESQGSSHQFVKWP